MDHENQDTFGSRLRLARKSLGLTQAEFGKIGGIGLTAQCMYEKGERQPTLDYLVALNEKKIDTNYLITGNVGAENAPTGADMEMLGLKFFNWMEIGHKNFTPLQKAGVLRKLYEIAIKNGGISEELIDGLLELVDKTRA